MNDRSMPALRQLIGESFRSVEALIFMPPGDTAPSLDNLDQLRITIGTVSIRFVCSSDGEQIAIDRDELRPIDLGEYGDLRLLDVAHYPLFETLKNKPLRRVSLITSHACRLVIGCMFEFGGGALIVCNWGDELKVWPTIPDNLFADEKIHIASA